MKALRTKVILSGIVLIFAFIATIGTTFAWFTISETVAVDGINLQVTSSDNLLVRVDTGTAGNTDSFAVAPVTEVANYQSSLTLADITAVPKYTAIGDWRLSPVTAVQANYDAVDAKFLNELDSTYETRNLTLSSTYNGSGGGYIELHFWLYSQAASARPIEVQDISITTTETDAQLQAIADAVRFGIWLDDNSTTGDAYILGNDTEFGFEFLSGQAGYADPLATDPLFNKLNEADKNIESATPTPFNKMTNSSDELLNTVTGYDRVLLISGTNDNTQDLFTIQPETPTLVTVRIFIEGWDAEATNAIVNANFDLSLGFRFGTVDV
ncbi:MAG: hypothetical protein K9L64_05375 [Candidatus Izimaplasma sp.]|nr:hypothetical protein [Candidatus Izimaplasma bacterium]